MWKCSILISLRRISHQDNFILSSIVCALIDFPSVPQISFASRTNANISLNLIASNVSGLLDHIWTKSLLAFSDVCVCRSNESFQLILSQLISGATPLTVLCNDVTSITDWWGDANVLAYRALGSVIQIGRDWMVNISEFAAYFSTLNLVNQRLVYQQVFISLSTATTNIILSLRFAINAWRQTRMRNKDL